MRITKQYFLISIVLLFSLIMFGIRNNTLNDNFTPHQHGDNSANKPSKSVKDIPRNIDLGTIYKNLKIDCGGEDFDCLAGVLKKITEDYGPRSSLSILAMMQQNGKVSNTIDPHSFAHVVGGKTAEIFGYDLEAFSLCPTTGHFGGCQHGFFEALLENTGSYETAEKEICQPIINNKNSTLSSFNCYHGLGHGIYMMQAHNLESSLKICDSFDNQKAHEWCWSGVFNMAFKEPINKESPEEFFNPCTNLEKRYRHQCFVYIVEPAISYFGSIQKVAEACSSFEENGACALSLGSFITNSSWVNRQDGQIDFDDLLSKAASTCYSFPEKMRTACISGAQQRLIFNNQTPDVTKDARNLCAKIDRSLKENCFREIGRNISIQIASLEERRAACALTPPEFSKYCFEGAGFEL